MMVFSDLFQLPDLTFVGATDLLTIFVCSLKLNWFLLEIWGSSSFKAIWTIFFLILSSFLFDLYFGTSVAVTGFCVGFWLV